MCLAEGNSPLKSTCPVLISRKGRWYFFLFTEVNIAKPILTIVSIEFLSHMHSAQKFLLWQVCLRCGIFRHFIIVSL